MGRRVWTAELDAKLIELAAEGLGNAEIGRRLGLSRAAVVNRASTLRSRGTPVTNRQPRWSPEEWQRVRALVAEGRSYPDIARITGRSVKALSSAALRAGLRGTWVRTPAYFDLQDTGEL